MKTSLNCPQGHTWQFEPSANGATQACPTCGAAALTPSDLYTPATVPPRPPELETVAPRADPFRTLPPTPADPRDAATVAPSDASTTMTGSAGQPSVPGYELLAELGRGGMGVVYQARHLKLNRVVALKMILAGSHAGAADLARFQTEAEAIARLQHPNIVQVYEVGEHEGKPFFSLEFCGGGSLAQKLNATPLLAREAAALLETLARAMQAAHDQHIIHRDLKPANVLLTEAGVPKITDFGLAKKLDEAGQTHSGAIMGTPSYMAPEQAGGKSGAIGPAADVYALGALLYECLTGRPPFKAATALDTIMQVVSDEPVPPRQLNAKVPADLETVCLKCLHKEPLKRYSSAAALADDLGRFQRGEPVQARPVGRLERGIRWARRNPALAAAMTAVAVALLLGTGISAYFAVAASSEAMAAKESEEKATESATAAKQSEEKAKESEATAKRSEKKAKASAAAAKESEEKAKDSAAVAKQSEKKAKESEATEKKARDQAEGFLATSRMMLARSRFEENQAGLAEDLLKLVPGKFRSSGWGLLKNYFQGSLFTTAVNINFYTNSLRRIELGGRKKQLQGGSS